MKLDPAFDAMLALPGIELTRPSGPDGAKALRAAFAELRPDLPLRKVRKVVNTSFRGAGGSVDVRIYMPNARRQSPVVVFFHGGGFVLCDIETHDPLCRSLAKASDCAVVSVNYRLAPEAPFPAALEDCYAATRWVSRNAGKLGFDAKALAVAGDSAGGNLAAAVTLLARDRGGPRIHYQGLIYPVTDGACELPSMTKFGRGYMLTQEIMQWFWDCYVPDRAQRDNPLASPLRACDLSRLPAATVITAEFDPLRDEGEAYAERLRCAGVPVQARRYLGMIHGFVGMPHVTPVAEHAIAHLGNDLQRALNPG